MADNCLLLAENCAVCKIPANLFCSACKAIKYCGVEHQRQHWKEHKTACRPFRIAKDAQLGRYLLATRYIKAESVIFTEMPLIVGPKWYVSEQEEKAPVMPCVGCFTPCRIGVHKCPNCQWPVCSTKCAGLRNLNLHGLECTVLMLGPGPTSNDLNSLINYYRCDALVVLKCLLLQRQNPKKWSELMNMQSHEKERLGSELQNDAEKRIVRYLQENFLERLKEVEKETHEQYLKENNTEILHRLCGIIETNYMCINLPSGLELSGVFYTACMMEHSCIPNCYFRFDYRNGFKISIIAGRDIAKNEHLIIMYSNMLWGTQMRHEHLTITKHFCCKCARCTDPSELDTYFSALLCVGDVGKDCGGVQLAKDALDAKTDWTCNQCPIIVNGNEVRYLLTQMAEETEELLARKPTIQQLETLIAKLSKFLHPNHYQLFSLKHTLIQLYGKQNGYLMEKLNVKQLSNKENICQELLNICKKLDPYTIRLSIYVAIIFYELHTVAMERGKRLATKNADDKQKAIEEFNKAKEYLIDAAKVLKKELDGVAGIKLNDAILKAIKELNILIKKNLIK